MNQPEDYNLGDSLSESSEDCSKVREQVVRIYICVLLLLSHFSRVRLCATPQTAAHQAPPSLGFSRQKHWSGLPFPSPYICVYVYIYIHTKGEEGSRGCNGWMASLTQWT